MKVDRKSLLAWYRRNRRDLPWRRTDDPYRIWLSEVMLQQTTVKTATPYYAAFLEGFPTLEALAEAVRHLREAVRLMPGSAEAVNGLGIGLWLAGKRDEALTHFQRALEIDPNHAGARRNLEAAAKDKPAALR